MTFAPSDEAQSADAAAASLLIAGIGFKAELLRSLIIYLTVTWIMSRISLGTHW